MPTKKTSAVGVLLLLAVTQGKASKRFSPEWNSAFYKTGIVCTDMKDNAVAKCSDGTEKAMREAATQLPQLPKGVTFEAQISDNMSLEDPYDYEVLILWKIVPVREAIALDMSEFCTVPRHMRTPVVER